MSIFSNFTTSGLLKKTQVLSLKLLFVLCYVIYITDARLSSGLLAARALLVAPESAPLITPTMTELPLPANLPLFHKPWKKYVSPHSTPKVVPAPAHSPYYDPLITSGHSPTSSQLSKPLMKKLGFKPPSPGLVPPRLDDMAPISNGLAQPPLSPYVSNCCKPDMVLKRASRGCNCVYPIKVDLLLNVSQNPIWNLFFEELASQLGLRGSQIELINFYVISLSRLNISMDITPHTGISFTADAAAKINSSLTMHKVHLDPILVGDYKLLNLTWFSPPPLSHAPLAASSPLVVPTYKSPSSTTPANSKRATHSYLRLIIGIGVGVLIITIISTLIICLCTYCPEKTKLPPEVTGKRRTANATIVVGTGSFPHLTSTRFLAYEELKEATNNFESASILGEGGFGKVFKGVLSDGTAVAIKRLNNGGHQGDKEFLCEVEMLSRLHHRNLVKLVGYYTSRDSVQNLLCYELVPNGSLDAWLHGPQGVSCPLDWDTRMKIALDAARGLAYLHEDSQPSVIHRDFKASNILLENDFHAKVADFGLAKQAPEGGINYLSTRVMGTFGYVAPEYAMTGHLLVKSDVYSYGVVLLELLTGRMPVDMSQPSRQENLVTWARPILRDKDRLEELVDPRLERKYPKEDFIRVCTIAAACVAPEANQRPTMGEVVQSLKMVQRVLDHQHHDSTLNSSNTQQPNNLRQSSTFFESDGTSSMFSSGYSGHSVIDNDIVSRTAVFSEDLHEGR